MDFAKEVLKLVKKIPRGRITTYKILAEELNTKAYRAIGQTLKRNSNAPVIPCHRVVRSDGGIGGYLGNKIKLKIKLLKTEGIEVKNGRVVNFGKRLWKKVV
ncbi:cysteine methyltransferase [Candidatus Shapirobacteria bacterium RBG_13_44_7]|uniref:Cysteine methyltransferase n=1 Tax=Candidatus Shapirobacteria bacterium RBG_13_44_7 TaxID=1802149 RepID=A0A1F7SEP5_9BACT|nr:MAG: cysteine methyltransferase [Candidatus Shapirobacteria bacterium RBG_13_44_7]